MKRVTIKRALIGFTLTALVGSLWIYFSFRVVCTGEDLTAACVAAEGTYEATFNERWEELLAKVEANICSNPEDAALILAIGPLDTHPAEEQMEFFIRLLSNQPECALEAINKMDQNQFRNIILIGQHLRRYDFEEATIAKRIILELKDKSENAKALAKTLSP